MLTASDPKGTPGFLSYDEISQMMEVYAYTAYYDDVAAVNYMS